MGEEGGLVHQAGTGVFFRPSTWIDSIDGGTVNPGDDELSMRRRRRAATA